MLGDKDLTSAQHKILIESEKVLGKKGISGLELKNVAKVLKVAPSTINYHYASSEELIFDTVLFSYGKYVQEIADETQGIIDPEKVLKIWIKNTFAWTKELPGIGEFLNSHGRLLKKIKKHLKNQSNF